MANKRYVDPMLKGKKMRNGLPEDVIITNYPNVEFTTYGNYPDDLSGIDSQMKGDSKQKRRSNQKY
jgi:hypothetical protein